jgi:hypothetical protein
VTADLYFVAEYYAADFVLPGPTTPYRVERSSGQVFPIPQVPSVRIAFGEVQRLG